MRFGSQCPSSSCDLRHTYTPCLLHLPIRSLVCSQQICDCCVPQCPFCCHVVRYVLYPSDLHVQILFSCRRRSDRVTRTIFENLLDPSFPQVRQLCDLRHTLLVLRCGSALTCTFPVCLTRRQQPHTCNGSHVSGCVWPVATTQRPQGRSAGRTAQPPGSNPGTTPPGVPSHHVRGDRGALAQTL